MIADSHKDDERDGKGPLEGKAEITIADVEPVFGVLSSSHTPSDSKCREGCTYIV